MRIIKCWLLIDLWKSIKIIKFCQSNITCDCSKKKSWQRSFYSSQSMFLWLQILCFWQIFLLFISFRHWDCEIRNRHFFFNAIHSETENDLISHFKQDRDCQYSWAISSSSEHTECCVISMLELFWIFCEHIEFVFVNHNIKAQLSY